MTKSGPKKRPSRRARASQSWRPRLSLPHGARVARLEYAAVFGYEPDNDALRELHADLIRRHGVSEAYPVKNLQNWFSCQRARMRQGREPAGARALPPRGV